MANIKTIQVAGSNYNIDAYNADQLTSLTSTDEASTTATERRVWFAYNDNVTGRPAYDDDFSYRRDIRRLKANKIKSSTIGDDVFIAYPSGGSYRTNYDATTGYLKITLPQSWTNTMFKFKVDIYTYSGTDSCEYTIGGYNYSPSSSWYNVTATSVAKSPNLAHANLTVRFGHDGSKCAIYIGESNTYWSYVQVQVHDVMVGYSNYSYEQWAYNWGVGFTTTLGTITDSVTNPAVNYWAAHAGYVSGTTLIM